MTTTWRESIKARKFVNGLLPDLYVTVKPHNDQTWNGAVDRAKAYELTHRDQGAVSAYLNKFTLMTTTDHTGDLLKAIQDLSRQVQSIGSGYRENQNNNGFRNAKQQPMVQTAQDSTIAGSIGAARKYRRAAFKLGGVPQEGKRTCQTTIPSNLTLLEIYPAMRTTRSKARLDPTTGTVKEKPLEEETIVRTIQSSGKAKQPIKSTGVKKVELKKVAKKKSATVTPIYKMDKIEEQDKKLVKKNDEIPNDGNVSEVKDLMQVANTAGPNDDRTSALYCEASIKHIRFPLIVDSGSAGSIISLSLLKDLDMEITRASKTIMVNVNGERRRPLGAVTDIPLKIHDFGNDWLRKTKAVLDYNNNRMTIKWKNQVLEVTTECREMPYHITSIEIPNIEAEEEAEDKSEKEVDEETVEESEEEYESDDEETQEQLFSNAGYITQEKAQEIEEELKENFIPENWTKNSIVNLTTLWNAIRICSPEILTISEEHRRNTTIVERQFNNSIKKSMDFASGSGGKEKWQKTSLRGLSEVKPCNEMRPISIAKDRRHVGDIVWMSMVFFP
ncbi:hypothetical protein C1646_776955 [Rhizophagus diaphanus]|nr:hypothetical protein C1646_776955 [Rhizophagus diaphanus] [Rhizophagus sp. MUCL 43196]